MSQHLDEAERLFVVMKLLSDAREQLVPIASRLQRLGIEAGERPRRATASPPPHVEEEKAAGEAEPSANQRAWTILHRAMDVGAMGGTLITAPFEVLLDELTAALEGKASAAREVEREHPVALLTEIDAAIAALDLEPPRGLAHDGALDRATLALLSCRAALFPNAKAIPPELRPTKT